MSSSWHLPLTKNLAAVALKGFCQGAGLVRDIPEAIMEELVAVKSIGGKVDESLKEKLSSAVGLLVAGLSLLPRAAATETAAQDISAIPEEKEEGYSWVILLIGVLVFWQISKKGVNVLRLRERVYGVLHEGSGTGSPSQCTC